MGRQPFGLASPAAWLSEAGADVRCLDLTREKLQDDAFQAADVVGFFLPMHTATRLALPVIDRVRAINPRARVIAYGLYAPLNATLLRERGVTDVLGGEFEAELVERALSDDRSVGPQPRVAATVPRLQFKVPSREGLPPLTRYATLLLNGERRTVGYTEASRGCKHRCRHCPIVPVYDGRFRIIPPEIVMADVRAQVGSGARHITFGDPDFFNGIRHAEAVMYSHPCRESLQTSRQDWAVRSSISAEISNLQTLLRPFFRIFVAQPLIDSPTVANLSGSAIHDAARRRAPRSESTAGEGAGHSHG